MPKYLVEMHDGRKFQVEADAPPSEADVMAHLGHGPSVVSPDEPGTYAGGFMRSLGDTAKRTGAGILEGLNPIEAVKGLAQTVAHPIDAVKGLANTVAHPVETAKSLSDPETGGKAIGGLLLGAATGRLAPHVPDAMVAGGKAIERAGEMSTPMSLPLAIGEAAARGDWKGGAMIAGGPYAARGAGALIRKAGEAMGGGPQAAEAAALPTGPHMDRSVPVRPSELTPQQLRERVFQGTGAPPQAAEKPMLGGRLQMAPPITVAPESPMQPPSVGPSDLRQAELLDKFGGRGPMTEPRVQVGAEVVGRQNGLTKEAVRQQTGPLFNEAPGSASPVVPQTPFDRMHDKLLSMGHGNPERNAYVQAAGDPKTAGQLEIMRRTLERNGLSVAAAASMAEVLRQAVMDRLRGADQQQ